MAKEEKHSSPTCKTCGFYENNCPYIRGKFVPYPSRVCKDYSEMKEQKMLAVDLEKELQAFLCNYDYEFDDDPVPFDIATHFYELGLKARKGEQEQQEVNLEEFTEKMDDWKARFNHPDDIPIKATMTFTARMFYMYSNVARQWYEQLPKATMD